MWQGQTGAERIDTQIIFSSFFMCFGSVFGSTESERLRNTTFINPLHKQTRSSV